MKKFIFALTAMMLACVAQAASEWTANLAFNTTEDYSGYTVWAVSYWNPYRTQYYPSETAPSTGYSTKYNYQSVLESATTPQQQINVLNAAKTTDQALFTSVYGKDAVFSTIDAQGKSSLTAVNDNIMYSWLLVLVKDLDASGNATYGTKYAVVQAPEQSPQVTGEVSSPTYNPSVATQAGGYTITIGDANVMTSGIVAVPEPTSALLLLLGLAGLSLRRKRV